MSNNNNTCIYKVRSAGSFQGAQLMTIEMHFSVVEPRCFMSTEVWWILCIESRLWSTLQICKFNWSTWLIDIHDSRMSVKNPILHHTRNECWTTHVKDECLIPTKWDKFCFDPTVGVVCNERLELHVEHLDEQKTLEISEELSTPKWGKALARTNEYSTYCDDFIYMRKQFGSIWDGHPGPTRAWKHRAKLENTVSELFT